MTAAIRTVGLTKRYGSVTAVDGIDLDVPPGDIYGFLGPNGSGKTTTVRMLLGLVLPTAGTVEVLGARIPKHARSVLHRVGALVEAPAAYGHLGARANLSIMDAAGPGGSRRTRRARIDQALEQVGLAGVGRRPVKAYSLGMRQRLGIAAALLRKPDLLILDEPTNGLDPRGIQEIRQLLLDLNASAGTTIFLSSHLLAEVEHLCTPGRRGRPGPAGAAGLAGRAAGADRVGGAADARPGVGGRRARRRPAGAIRRPARGPRGRPGRAERAAGRARDPDHRARRGAADAGGGRAGGDHRQLGPGGRCGPADDGSSG